MPTGEESRFRPMRPSHHNRKRPPKPDRELPAGFNAEEITLEERRRLTGELWLKGYNAVQISGVLGVTAETVRRDITLLRTELQIRALPNLQEELQRTLDVHRMVEAEAWGVVAATAEHQVNKVAALNVILQSEERIAKLVGIAAPDSINSAAMAEIMATLQGVLREVGGPELLRTFLASLARRTGTSVGAMIAAGLGSRAPSASALASAVEADVYRDYAPPSAGLLPASASEAEAEAAPAPESDGDTAGDHQQHDDIEQRTD